MYERKTNVYMFCDEKNVCPTNFRISSILNHVSIMPIDR